MRQDQKRHYEPCRVIGQLAARWS